MLGRASKASLPRRKKRRGHDLLVVAAVMVGSGVPGCVRQVDLQGARVGAQTASAEVLRPSEDQAGSPTGESQLPPLVKAPEVPFVIADERAGYVVMSTYTVVRAFCFRTWGSPHPDDAFLLTGAKAKVDTQIGQSDFWGSGGEGLQLGWQGRTEYRYRDAAGTRLLKEERVRIIDTLILTQRSPYKAQLVDGDLSGAATESGIRLGDSEERLIRVLGDPSHLSDFPPYQILWYLGKPTHEHSDYPSLDYDWSYASAYAVEGHKVVEIWLHVSGADEHQTLWPRDDIAPPKETDMGSLIVDERTGRVQSTYAVVRGFCFRTWGWRSPDEDFLLTGAKPNVDTKLGQWTFAEGGKALAGVGKGLQLWCGGGGAEHRYRDASGTRLLAEEGVEIDTLILTQRSPYDAQLVKRDLSSVATESGIQLGDSRERVVAVLGDASRISRFPPYEILWYLGKPTHEHPGYPDHPDYDWDHAAAYAFEKGRVVEIWLHFWSTEACGG